MAITGLLYLNDVTPNDTSGVSPIVSPIIVDGSYQSSSVYDWFGDISVGIQNTQPYETDLIQIYMVSVEAEELWSSGVNWSINYTNVYELYKSIDGVNWVVVSTYVDPPIEWIFGYYDSGSGYFINYVRATFELPDSDSSEYWKITRVSGGPTYIGSIDYARMRPSEIFVKQTIILVAENNIDVLVKGIPGINLYENNVDLLLKPIKTVNIHENSIDVLISAKPPVNIQESYVEVLIRGYPTYSKLTHDSVEIIFEGVSSIKQTQLAFEVVQTNVTEARLSGIISEIIGSGAPVVTTQLPQEIVFEGSKSSKLTQNVLEVVSLNNIAKSSQFIVEVVKGKELTRITHLSFEAVVKVGYGFVTSNIFEVVQAKPNPPMIRQTTIELVKSYDKPKISQNIIEVVRKIIAISGFTFDKDTGERCRAIVYIYKKVGGEFVDKIQSDENGQFYQPVDPTYSYNVIGSPIGSEINLDIKYNIIGV